MRVVDSTGTSTYIDRRTARLKQWAEKRNGLVAAGICRGPVTVTQEEITTASLRWFPPLGYFSNATPTAYFNEYFKDGVDRLRGTHWPETGTVYPDKNIVPSNKSSPQTSRPPKRISKEYKYEFLCLQSNQNGNHLGRCIRLALFKTDPQYFHLDVSSANDYQSYSMTDFRLNSLRP